MCKTTFVNNAHLKKHIESDHTLGPICAGFMHSGVLGDIPNPEGVNKNQEGVASSSLNVVWKNIGQQVKLNCKYLLK